MLFNSFHFLIFFSVVFFFYFAIPHTYRWLLLLLSSCYFYMAFIPIYILILGFTIVVDYFAGIFIEKTKGKIRKVFLITSLIANIGVLVIFKYYNFFNENLTLLLHGFALTNPFPFLSILLPIGLSFHTFQAMSYTIEVYRENHHAEHHFGIYALYVMFFPQLVAGPIERPGNLLHQFREKHNFDYERVTDGLRLMAWGLFKKVVIADRLAVVVDTVNAHPQLYNSLSLIISAIFFAFQVYCDFSGYSDIAIGAARVMGFTLMKNFNFPYCARTFSEFWRRWHISLSSWFRDYLYFSMGGNRVTVLKWCFNIFVVFLISGLWHGANWTYIIFGALQGFFVVFGMRTQNIRNKWREKLYLHKITSLQYVTTFLLFALSLIIFRANNIHDAFYMEYHLFSGIPNLFSCLVHHQSVFQNLGVNKIEFSLSLFLIILLECIQYMQRRINVVQFIKEKPMYVRWALYYFIFAAIIFLGVFENRQFIYFQF
jgi:alginate O-acetyltransferase complex protein AlgI